MWKPAAWCSMCALLLPAFAATAQEATKAAAVEGTGEDKPVQLDRVMVTARRRNEGLQ
jgi:hypothetical protein